MARWRRVALVGVAAIIASGAIIGTLVWVAMRPAEPAPPRVSRLQVTPSGTAALTIDWNDRDLAITPDGSRVIYVGNRGTQLFVRALDALEPVAVFTGAPRGPFVSPDGQWIGFVDGRSVLKKVAVTGGPAVTLATLDTAVPAARPGDRMTRSSSRPLAWTTGLQRVAAAGGPTTVLTRPDRAQGEADHFWPEMLPGGRAVLFTITALTGGLDAAQVAVLDLQTGTRKILVRGGSHAHYVSEAAISSTRRPARCGRCRSTWRVWRRAGTPVPVVPDVVTTINGGVDAVVAGDGTLAYVSGSAAGDAAHARVGGPPGPRDADPGAAARVSPSRAVTRWHARRGVRKRSGARPLALGSRPHDAHPPHIRPWCRRYPVWTPDSRRLIFSSERAGVRNLFWQAADGTGAVERLTESPNTQYPSAVSPDGRRLIFTEEAPRTGNDVMQIELDGTRRVTPLVQSPFNERNGIVSPDGRWLAYEANDSGRFEIYVRPFPDVNSGHWQVSTNGGTRPIWARSGQELVYVSPTGALMRVGVARGPSWAATTPTLLVKEGYFTIPNWWGRSYDISADGQRFLMIKEGGADGTAAPASIIVVQHWVEELKRLVPTK